VGQHLAAQAHGDALTTLRQEQRELHRQEHRLLVAAIVAQLPFRGLRVEDDIGRELAQPGLDVPRGRRTVAGQDVPPVALGVDQQVLLTQLHERISDAGIPVRVVLHGVPDDVGHLVVPAVIQVLHGVQDAPLHGFQAIVQGGHGTLQDHVAGIVQEPFPVHAAYREDTLLRTRRPHAFGAEFLVVVHVVAHASGRSVQGVAQ